MWVSECFLWSKYSRFGVQVFIDIFGYLIWFIYVPAVGQTAAKLVEFYKLNKQHDREANIDDALSMDKGLLATHFIFTILLSFFAIVWLLFANLYSDFHFKEIENEDKTHVFLQILFETLLVIEWIHVALESIHTEIKAMNKESKQHGGSGCAEVDLTTSQVSFRFVLFFLLFLFSFFFVLQKPYFVLLF